jgi:hypothetical protein
MRLFLERAPMWLAGTALAMGVVLVPTTIASADHSASELCNDAVYVDQNISTNSGIDATIDYASAPYVYGYSFTQPESIAYYELTTNGWEQATYSDVLLYNVSDGTLAVKGYLNMNYAC